MKQCFGEGLKGIRFMRRICLRQIAVIFAVAGLCVSMSAVSQADELDDLKEQMKQMQAQIDQLSLQKTSSTSASQQKGFNLGEHSTLDFHGYTRLGTGISDGGATQAYFKAPGAQAKYRLGNESDLGIELAFDYRYYYEDLGEDVPYAQFWIRTDSYDDYGGSDGLSLGSVPEAFVKLHDVAENGLSLWAGRRFYDRMDIHMIDYFWLNPGQGAYAGFGLEGIHLGTGEFKAAVFRLEDEFSSTTVDATRLDLRIKDIEVNEGGKLSLWSDFSVREADKTLGIKNQNGLGLGGWHTQSDVFSGTNTFAVLYRSGASMVQGGCNARPVRESDGYDLDDAHSMEANNNFLWEPSEDFAMQHAFVFRQEKRGVDNGDTLTWVSTGVRPVWFITDHFSVPVEIGLDYVDDEINNRNGTVEKYTIALQYAPSKGYYIRPVFRVFATTAHWGDAFKGLVGAAPDDAPYAQDTNGYTFGTQVEWWW